MKITLVTASERDVRVTLQDAFAGDEGADHGGLSLIVEDGAEGTWSAIRAWLEPEEAMLLGEALMRWGEDEHARETSFMKQHDQKEVTLELIHQFHGHAADLIARYRGEAPPEEEKTH